jgi:hypothetical protein
LSTSREQERVAECQRILEELGSFTDELNSWEKTFVDSMDSNITRWGLSTHVSDNQFDKLSEIYRRIVERS